jgi:hypothetical protein
MFKKVNDVKHLGKEGVINILQEEEDKSKGGKKKDQGCM